MTTNVDDGTATCTSRGNAQASATNGNAADAASTADAKSATNRHDTTAKPADIPDETQPIANANDDESTATAANDDDNVRIGGDTLPNQEDQASTLSRIFFSYVSDLVKRGAAAPLQWYDLASLRCGDDAAAMHARFAPLFTAAVDDALDAAAANDNGSNNNNNNGSSKNNSGCDDSNDVSLWRVLLRMLPRYWLGVSLSSTFSVLNALSPIFLRFVVDFVHHPDEWPLAYGLLCVGATSCDVKSFCVVPYTSCNAM
jgi:hypothetical protein